MSEDVDRWLTGFVTNPLYRAMRGGRRGMTPATASTTRWRRSCSRTLRRRPPRSTSTRSRQSTVSPASNRLVHFGLESLTFRLLAPLHLAALGCKRPAFDAGWLRSLHRPNVTLSSSGIREITRHSIIANDGSTFNPDVIIFATGSDVAWHGVGLNVGLHGEGGVELREHWASIGGPQALLGLVVPKFPNYFMVLGPNAIAGTWGWTLGHQSWKIAHIVRDMVDYGIGALQPRQEAFEKENREQQERLAGSVSGGFCHGPRWKGADETTIFDRADAQQQPMHELVEDRRRRTRHS